MTVVDRGQLSLVAIHTERTKVEFLAKHSLPGELTQAVTDTNHFT